GMDATQVINDSILESEEEESEEETENERRKPLAKLCILNNPHIPEKELPLFLGDNFLGRDPNLCTLQFLAPSVSKQHAAISISVHRRRGRVHEVDMEALVWDLKSMNGTRKGRLKLTPNVRYALSEGDSLVLGDIPCRYVSSGVDSPSSLGDVETPRQSEANARLSAWDDVDTGSKKCVSVSDSDSHKSSLNNSAFVSPLSKVIPESLEKTDVDLEKNKSPVLVKREGGKSPTESGESLRSPLQVSRDAVPEFNLDSDTDVEGGEEEEAPAGKSNQRPNTVLPHIDSDTDVDEDVSDKTPRTADSAPSVQSGDFHLDRDTDVDEEEEAGKRGNPKTDETLSEKSGKPLSPHSLHPDSDACDKEVAAAGLDILSESDTDLEEDSLPAVPAAAADLPVSSAAAAGAPESDADTDVDEPVAPRAADESKPADLRMESDTDVEDEEANPGEEEEGRQRENALRQNCSTPVQVSGLNPNRASVLESSAVKPEDRYNRDDSFQLGLSDSSHLQGEARENARAYATVDGGVDMEDTQDYEESAENDSNLEATQPYEVEPHRSSSRKETCVDLTMEATQAYIQEPYDEGSDEDEGLNSARTESVTSSALAMAETQPMFSFAEDNEPDCSSEPVKNETKRHVADSESVAETQPMFTSDNEESGNEELTAVSLKSAKEQKHPRTSSPLCLAETQPVRLSDDEESGEELSAESLRPSKVETHPNTDAALPLAETQRLHVGADETEPKDSCGDHENNSEILLPRKRKAKQLHIDEEESQQRTDSGETQPLTPGEDDDDSMPSLRKRKAKPLQLEDETQSLVGSQVFADGSRRSLTCEEEQSSQDFISTRKRKAKQLHIEDEQTQPLISCEDEDILPEKETKALPLTAAGVPPAEVQAEGRDGKRDGDESITYPRKRKEKRLHLEEEEMQPVSTKDDNIQQEVKAVNKKTRGRRTTRKWEEQDGDKNKTAENENQMKLQRRGKLRGEPERHNKREELMNEGTSKPHLEDETKLVTASESQRRIDGTKKESKAAAAGTKETGEQTKNKDESDQQEENVVNQQTRRRRTTRKQEQDEDKNKSQTKEQRDGKLREYKEETERHKEKEELNNEETSKSHLQDEMQPVTVSEVSPANTLKKNDVFDASSISSSMETRLGEEEEKAQCSSRQNRQTKTENKPLPSTRGRRGKTKSEDDDNQEEVKAANQRSRGRRSTKKQDDDDERQRSDENKSQIKEEGDKEEREHVETERRNEREGKSKGKHRLKETRSGGEVEEEKGTSVETTKTDQEHLARLEKEKQPKESQEDKNGEENPKGSARVRRAARRTTTAVCEASSEDVLARRTRSRSNSLSSERSVSSVNDNTPDNKGRGRGAKRSSEVSQTDTVRSNRRRTTTATAAEPDAEAQAVSATSKVSRGRPQGRGRKTLSLEAVLLFSQVLFTGVVDEDGEQVLARLGGAMARGVSDMNCLVTDKVRRTVKFLCAVAKGVPVVTTRWLEQSGKAGSFLSPLAFVVNDPEQEKKFSFSLQESLRTASSQPLLQGYEIHVTKSVKPEPVHMKDIITCSGATFLTKMPAAHKPRTVVISCEEDLRLCGPAVSASLPVVTAEFILTGILQQRVDLQTHALSPSATNPQPAEGRGRGRKKT
uniref:Mediator of DNA damage checkpoint protein 1 n=1 Tax=Poecilia reticulata TaxID=8081 RepID=A0A3P9PBT4_POERE